MVHYLVDGFRRRPELGIEVYHVDTRLSEDLKDVGSARGGKLPRLLRYCREARQLGRERGIRAIYYVPSPPRRTPLYRDWLALMRLRGRFPDLIYHWHSAGLGDWVEREARPWERAITRRLLGQPALSLVLAEVLRPDAEYFQSLRTEVVNNAVEDPCPDYAYRLKPIRRARVDRRRAAGGEVRVLFLALCSEDKGIFDAIEAVARANAEAAAGTRAGGRLRFHLTVAGGFPDSETERRVRQRMAAPDVAGCVEYTGFLKGEAKRAAMESADVLLFPSFYAFETHPLSVVEAMAFGLPVVATRWRGIPEMLPGRLADLVEPGDPTGLARELARAAVSERGPALRTRYEQRYTLDRFLERLASALKTVESPVSTAAWSGPGAASVEGLGNGT
jgi:glycosyltransferase involved in cell wall biosynthesis